MKIFERLCDSHCVGCSAWGVMLCDFCIQSFTSKPHRASTSRGIPLVALGSYHGGLRALILAAKHRNSRGVIRRLGGALREAALPWGNVIAIPVPSSRPGFLARGYGLGSAIARAAEFTVSNCLVMDDYGTQRGRHRIERLRRDIRVGSRRPPTGSRVIIVDDVMTTGASIDAATDACIRAGLRVVGILVVAIAEHRITAPLIGQAPV